MAEDWSARQYLKFEDERTRPPRDLLAQVPLQSPRRVIDLGCGPGNSTELLITRYPQADVVGVDSSSDMLRQARERLPYCTFAEADLATWSPPEGTVRVHLVDGGLIVGDDGPGIADEDLPLVFDRFYRSPEARMLPGSGLGLAIVRQAAERHGGHVAVGHSASGGAELWLGIPGSSTPAQGPLGQPSEGGAKPG